MNYLERREQKAEQQGRFLEKEETARNFLSMGIDVEKVVQGTGLDFDTVLKLKKEIGTKTKH